VSPLIALKNCENDGDGNVAQKPIHLQLQLSDYEMLNIIINYSKILGL